MKKNVKSEKCLKLPPEHGKNRKKCEQKRVKLKTLKNLKELNF